MIQVIFFCVLLLAHPLFIMEADAQEQQTKISRYVQLPPFRVYQGSLLRSQSDYTYEGARFHLILTLASWNAASQEMARYFQGHLATFRDRQIAVVGVFTHDSETDLLRTVQDLGLTFPVSQVSLNFVRDLRNPKVPTLWITDHRGHVLYRLVRPSQAGLEQVRRFLLSWTDF